MLPEISIEGRTITVKNVGEYGINWSRLLDGLREKSGYRLHEISAYAGVTHTRVMHASAYSSCRFSNCEQIALLDLYQEFCAEINGGIFITPSH